LVATAVSQTVLFVVYPHLVSSAMLSTVVATAVSTVPAYYLNRAWTWGKRGKSHLWKEVVPFWAMAFIGLVLATIIVGLAAKNAHHISTARHFKTLFVHFAYLFSYALIWVARYSLMNKFLFGTHTHQRPLDAAVDTVAVERVGPGSSH
jgi:putative flippase GtrA